MEPTNGGVCGIFESHSHHLTSGLVRTHEPSTTACMLIGLFSVDIQQMQHCVGHDRYQMQIASFPDVLPSVCLRCAQHLVRRGNGNREWDSGQHQRRSEWNRQHDFHIVPLLPAIALHKAPEPALAGDGSKGAPENGAPFFLRSRNFEFLRGRAESRKIPIRIVNYWLG